MDASDVERIGYIYDDRDDVNDESDIIETLVIDFYISRMSTRKIITFDDDLLRRVEDYRFQERIRSEAEAIRKLIELGLSAVADDVAREEDARPDA